VDRREGERRQDDGSRGSQSRQRELLHEPAEQQLLAERGREADRREREQARRAFGRRDDAVELRERARVAQRREREQ
jgi:hypothetical protein